MIDKLKSFRGFLRSHNTQRLWHLAAMGWIAAGMLHIITPALGVVVAGTLGSAVGLECLAVVRWMRSNADEDVPVS
ncbi:MAG: hypothetical protein C7B46_17135 [Sulfobacillus benefaciens]|uniref:Uncharacterized protein n=1 Tax=Sulfobacillus benefaciens TaxID=453960 RepID=A0A2T2X9P6_9FIRM|nr:MAG: hypothetical protein C7B46_17135 [Sulfobacillus benefaciens]